MFDGLKKKVTSRQVALTIATPEGQIVKHEIDLKDDEDGVEVMARMMQMLHGQG